jgi:hypothetical protein
MYSDVPHHNPLHTFVFRFHVLSVCAGDLYIISEAAFIAAPTDLPQYIHSLLQFIASIGSGYKYSIDTVDIDIANLLSGPRDHYFVA